MGLLLELIALLTLQIYVVKNKLINTNRLRELCTSIGLMMAISLFFLQLRKSISKTCQMDCAF